MLVGLPDDAATIRTLDDGWTLQLELAATANELLHAVYRALLGLGGVKNPPKQLRVPRPKPKPQHVTTSTQPRRRNATAEEVGALLGAMTAWPQGR